jgi:hypothetical protein
MERRPRLRFCITTDISDRRIFTHISAFPRTVSPPGPWVTRSVSRSRPRLRRQIIACHITVQPHITAERMCHGAAVARPLSSPRSSATRRLLIEGRRPHVIRLFWRSSSSSLVYVFVSVLWPIPPWVLTVYLVTSIAMASSMYAAVKAPPRPEAGASRLIARPWYRRGGRERSSASSCFVIRRAR